MPACAHSCLARPAIVEPGDNQPWNRFPGAGGTHAPPLSPRWLKSAHRALPALAVTVQTVRLASLPRSRQAVPVGAESLWLTANAAAESFAAMQAQPSPFDIAQNDRPQRIASPSRDECNSSGPRNLDGTQLQNGLNEACIFDLYGELNESYDGVRGDI